MIYAKSNIIFAIKFSLVCVLQWVVPSLASRSKDPDVGLSTVQMIENHRYVCESHTITTEDGYILTYHRIPHGKNKNTETTKPAALLMHGYAASSADYVNMGPNRSLGYILADNGYDVWIGNMRGNACWHEIGYYDLSAAIDYILNVTGGDGLHYIGHSMGGTAFLALMSSRPEYNSKIKLASLMAPPSFMEHVNNTVLRILGPNINRIAAAARTNKIYEVPYVEEIRRMGLNLCPQVQIYPFCASIFFALVGADEPQFDRNKIAVLFTNSPSNAALKPNYHYGQLIKNGGFSQYDFGRDENVRVYGTEKPPSYDLSKISAPVAIYCGKNDAVVNIKDVEKLVSKLPNVVNFTVVPYDRFNHFDFTYAIDVVKLLYNGLIKVMGRF